MTSATVGRDYSYLELHPLMEQLVRETVAAEGPQGVAAAERADGAAARASPNCCTTASTRCGARPELPARKSLPYAYYAKQYDLTRVSSEIETKATYGGVSYPRLLTSSFEIRARGESWVEHFTIVCGIDGPLAEVPVFMTYQPRWWLKLELVLDERQAF